MTATADTSTPSALPDALWDDLTAVFGDRPVRVLTVHQPHASLIAAAATVLDAKGTENRGWRIPPGPLVIYAGKQLDEHACRLPHVRRVLKAAGWQRISGLPRGALVCVVNVTGSHRADRGCCPLWGQPDQVHNQLTVLRAFPEPVPMRGKQGIWYLNRPVISNGVSL